MSDSDQEGFHEPKPETITLKIKTLATSRVFKTTNIKAFLYRSPLSLHHELQLYEYPRQLDLFASPPVNILPPPSTECLRLVQKREGAGMLLSDFFPRKMFCVYNRFHENLMLKSDTTIIIRNIARRIQNDQLTTFHERTKPLIPTHDLLFSADFEGGNLHCVYRDKRTGPYYLLLQNDTNTHGYNIWFHFNIRTAVPARHQFVIVNLARQITFDTEIAILVYSSISKCYERKIGFRCVESRFRHCQCDKNFWSLCFQYEFSAAEEIYVSLLPPYSNSKLMRFLKQIEQPLLSNIQVYTQIAGKSQLGNLIPCVRVGKRQKTAKKTILITARQHPCETVGSFICEEMLQLLVSGSPLSLALLDKFTFYVLPMINPDGVIHGNSRTNLMGYDLNRSWGKSMPMSSVECEQIWKFIQGVAIKQGAIAWAFDLHGHSKQLGFFAYFSQENQSSLVLNHLLKEKDGFYHGDSCIYSVGKSKRESIRGQLHQNLYIDNAVTIETSFYGYRDKEGVFHHFDKGSFQLIALHLLEAVLETEQALKEKPQKLKLLQRIQGELKGQNNAGGNEKVKEIQVDSDSNPEEDYLLNEERNQEHIFRDTGTSFKSFRLKTQEAIPRKYKGFDNVLKLKPKTFIPNTLTREVRDKSLMESKKSEQSVRSRNNLTFYACRRSSHSPNDTCQRHVPKIRRKIYSEVKFMDESQSRLSKYSQQQQEYSLKRTLEMKQNIRSSFEERRKVEGRTLIGGFRSADQTEVCKLQTIVYPTASDVAFNLMDNLKKKKQMTRQIRSRQLGNNNFLSIVDKARVQHSPLN